MCFIYSFFPLLRLMSLTCSLHVCSNCQTVSSSPLSVAVVDQLLVIIWVSAPLYSTLTQRKTSSFSARLPDMFYHSFYTLICICYHFELDCYVFIVGSLLHIMLLLTQYAIVKLVFFNISPSIHMCLLKCVSLILFLLPVADVLLSLNLCLPIEGFYHYNQSMLFTFLFCFLTATDDDVLSCEIYMLFKNILIGTLKAVAC
jgi:hypothetical protein